MKVLRGLRGLVAGSLGRKLVLSVLLVHCLLIALMTWQVMTREAQLLQEQRLSRAEGIANLLATSGAPGMLSEDLAGLGELVDSAGSIAAVRYTMFLSASGRVLAHPDQGRVGSSLAETALARSGGVRIVTRTPSSIDVAAPVRVNGNLAGWSWVSVSLADIHVRQRELAMSALGFGAAAVLLGLLLAVLAGRSVTVRLAELASATDRFRLGDRNVRIAGRGSDEVASAARGVNAMFEAVAEGERLLKEAQRIAMLGSWRFDPETRSFEASEPVHELFGIDPRSPVPAIDQLMRTLPEDEQGLIRKLGDLHQDQALSSFKVHITRPGGSQRVGWVEARSEVDPASQRNIMVGIAQDATDREAAMAQLRQAQKMEAVGQLTGGLAHDFNNLLAIIIGNLDLLEEELLGGGHQELVGEALSAALRGAEVTRQLLAFSRRQALAPQTIEVNQLISGVVALSSRTVGEEISLQVHLAKDLWMTRADPSQLESAVLNLVINARDAMRSGGTVTIETSNLSVKADEGDFAEPDIEQGDYSVITVSDTGAGMTPETAAQAFEPFFTTKPVGEGSGLGLSMIYGFAKQSGGHVKIYSELGHGTSVRLYLPRAEHQSDMQSRDATGQSALPRGAGERILLVDDDAAVRRVAERQLVDLGYRVVPAGSGLEALALLAQHPEIKLLFTDIVMPGGMNGIELADNASARYPNLKVLHASGFSRQAVGTQSDLATAGAFLSKPYRKSELAEKVRQVLDAPRMRVSVQ